MYLLKHKFNILDNFRLLTRNLLIFSQQLTTGAVTSFGNKFESKN